MHRGLAAQGMCSPWMNILKFTCLQQDLLLLKTKQLFCRTGFTAYVTFHCLFKHPMVFWSMTSWASRLETTQPNKLSKECNREERTSAGVVDTKTPCWKILLMHYIVNGGPSKICSVYTALAGRLGNSQVLLSHSQTSELLGFTKNYMHEEYSALTAVRRSNKKY